MKYEEPILEVIELKSKDIVCTSPNVEVDGPDNDSDWT